MHVGIYDLSTYVCMSASMCIYSMHVNIYVCGKTSMYTSKYVCKWTVRHA